MRRTFKKTLVKIIPFWFFLLGIFSPPPSYLLRNLFSSLCRSIFHKRNKLLSMQESKWMESVYLPQHLMAGVLGQYDRTRLLGGYVFFIKKVILHFVTRYWETGRLRGQGRQTVYSIDSGHSLEPKLLSIKHGKIFSNPDSISRLG